MASADAATSNDHGGHGHGDHGNDKVPGALRGFLKDNHEWFYFYTWMILTGLFIISYIGPFVGEALDLWILTMVTAFGVAVVKAGLVITRFMHLFEEPKFIWQMNATALVFMLLFFFWVSADVLKHDGNNWTNQAGAGITMTAHIEHFDVDVVWSERCATCHGQEGRGNGSEGTALYPRPTDFTSQAYWVNASSEQMALAILDGGEAVGGSGYMPGFRAAMAPEHGGGHDGEGDAVVAERVDQLIRRIMAFRPPPAPAPVAVPTPAPAPVPVPAQEIPLEGVVAEGDPAALEPLAPTGPSEAELAQRAAFIHSRVF